MPPAAKVDCGVVLFDLASPKKTELLNGLLKFAAFKWFMNSRSMYRLILINSEETENVKDYPNIYKTAVGKFDPKLILEVVENTPPGSGANWLDAMKLAIHHLEEAKNIKGLITLQLIFFTSLHYVSEECGTSAVAIQQSLNDNDIFLYFIGPDVKLPFAITNYDCLAKCMKELKADNLSGESLEAFKIAHKIVNCTKNSVICSTKIGIHLLYSLKHSPGSQEWRVPLSLGTKLSIPAPTSEGCLDIVCFTEKKFISETYLRGGDTYYILPSETDKETFQIFMYLFEVLTEDGKYGITKRVYAKTNKPKYFVLIPQHDFQPKYFIMTGLPYDGGLIPYKFGNPSAEIHVGRPEEHDFQLFFDSLIVETRDSKAGVSLGPTMMQDMNQQKIVNLVAKKYLGREDLDFQSLDINDFEVKCEVGNYL